MTLAEASPPGLRPVQIDVSNVTVRLALCFVAEDAGFVRGSSSEAITVSDTFPMGEDGRPLDVLVIDARRVAHDDVVDLCSVEQQSHGRIEFRRHRSPLPGRSPRTVPPRQTAMRRPWMAGSRSR